MTKYIRKRLLWTIIFFFLVVFFLPSPAQSQSRREAERVNSLLHQMRELYKQGRYQAAIPILEELLPIFERVYGPEDPETAKLLNNLAVLYDNMGNREKAEPLYERALDIKEKTLGIESSEYANSLNNLAAIYESRGQYAKAEPLYDFWGRPSHFHI